MKSPASRTFSAFAAFTAFAASLPLVTLPAFAAPATSPAAASAPAAAAVTAASSITAATVYPDRAVISRTASVTVSGGTTEVLFAGLPSTLLDESVQVAARGTVAASLLDISTRTVFVTAEPDARVKSLQDALLELRRTERALNDRAAILDSQRALVGTIENAYTAPVPAAAGATPPARPSLEDYAKLLSFSAEQRARLDADARALEIERTTLAEKIAAAENQLNELRGRQPGRRATKVVTVRLATPASGELEVSLGYALPGASWSPAYDARLRSTERKVQLDAFGVVRNSTGEDWTGIALTLSTARPGLGGSAPEIAPWYVDVARPVFAGKLSRSSMMLDQSIAKVAAAPATFSNNARFMTAVEAAPAMPEEAEAQLATAEVESAATSASFKIATPVTLASDNTPQRVPLGAAAFSAELQYQATPKLQETAYLAAYVKNTSDLPFLGGSLNVFLDDTFVAVSRLATTMPGEKFALNLGADEGISIKRKIVSRFTEDTGFTIRSTRTTYDILVTVTNNKRTPERIVVKDAAPLARDEKILVKLLAPAERELLKPEEAATQPPRPGIARDADGKLTWRFDLKPGEKRELPLRFSIEHPSDLPVSGVE